jgi:hypothetical protein
MKSVFDMLFYVEKEDESTKKLVDTDIVCKKDN